MNGNLKRNKMQDDSGSTEDLIDKEETPFSHSNGFLQSDTNYVVDFPKTSGRSIWKHVNKCLVLVLILLLIISLVFICLYMHASHEMKKMKKQTNKYCNTASCIEAAAFIKSAMEESINPCDDFYLYSCGGWLQNNPIPDGKSSWTVDSVLGDNILHTLKRILENSTIAKKTKSKAVGNVYKFYDSCTDEKAIKKLGPKPLIDMLNKVGQFKMNSGVKEDIFKGTTLTDLLKIYYKTMMTSSIFSVSVTVDDKNSSSYILKFSQAGLGLAMFRYKKNDTDKVLQAYVNYLGDVVSLLNYTNLNSTVIHSLANESFQLEKQLFNIHVPVEKLVTIEQTYHKTTLAQLQAKLPLVDLVQYVNNIFNGTGISITKEEPILVDTMEYFNKLNEVIKNTNKRVFQNYLLFRAASLYAVSLTPDFVELRKPLQLAKYGTYEEIPRWKRCVYVTESRLGMALSSLFVKEKFAAGSYDEANEMVENVRKAFVSGFSKLKWMDATTRKRAIEKADLIKQKIGYPKYILEPAKLDKKYEGLTFDGGYFANDFIIEKYLIAEKLKHLRSPVDAEKWEMTPMTVNAYFNPSQNEIVFTAAILQPPFFKFDYPKSVNYGGMGAIIGHELTHGFDNNGRQYNKHGNYESWWMEESVQHFKELSKCFVEEYSNFTLAGLHIKGNVTLGENLADNGGLKAAYKAYKAWVEEHGEEPLLPGVGKTNDELFFISYGQSWCTDELNTKIVSQINTDVHSPPIERVRGAIMNNEDFARIFKCPLGSQMNPGRKCSIW